MKLSIQVNKLAKAHEFLHGLSLVRKKSRERRRVLNLIQERIELYNKERRELLEEHSVKDGDGKAVIENENYKIEDYQALHEDLLEFEKEMPLVIEGIQYQETLKVLQSVFEELEDERYEGEESEVYDYLYDQLENQNKQGDDE
ncbi:DUF1617 family protein [Shouchella lehensis]|uniref:Uncharacterized protein n=1 Tax=Shouchella lehensis G1 TaxID=1246626 RepID=A0A060LUL5_9BACI|nr:DUF1617 family protein [Shouchella lehensis]AIC93837.1 hypothetical protein BleG1_1254 [Shouchella lehensis G1]